MAEWTKDQIIARIRGEAQKQDVDPDLAVAVATQESYLNPNAKGDNGKSLGLFQLQPAAAIDVGVNPQWRQDPGVNIYGGVSYLKQKLQQSKGNVEEALRRYNGGGDPNYVQNVFRFFKPGVAEASAPMAGTYTDADVQHALQALGGTTPPQAPAGGTYSDEDVQNALTALGGGPAPAPAPATRPSPPTATSTPEQDAAYRAWAAQQAPGATPPPAPVSQTTPSPAAHPGGRQGPAPPEAPAPEGTATPQEAQATLARLRTRQATAATPEARLQHFQQLPAITALSPAERQAAVAEFQGMNEAQQRAFLASEPAADLPTAIQEGPRPTPEQQLRPQRKPSAVEPPLEEGITKPSTMIPLLLPGAGAKAGMRLVPEAWRWVGRVGGEAVTQTAAELGGRALETGQAPSFKDIATTTAWNLAPQAGEELLRAVPRTILRSGQGARTIIGDVAAQESKGLGRRVFHPQDEQVLSDMFEQVRRSGVKLDIDPVTDLLTSLTPSQRQVLLRDVKAISSPMAAALQRTGQPGAMRLTGWDIGDLQTMRSELITRAQRVRAPERQDLINDLRMAVDDAIERGMAVGSTAAGGNPETLRAAQAGWRRLRQSDDLQALVTKHTSFSPNARYQDLNLAALHKSLKGTNALGRKVAGSLGEAEHAALQQELTRLARHYPFVKVPSTVLNITGGAGLPAAGYQLLQGNVPGAAATATAAVVALALQSPRAMEIFRSTIVHGKGRLSTNDIAAIINAVRQGSDVEEPSGTAR